MCAASPGLSWAFVCAFGSLAEISNVCKGKRRTQKRLDLERFFRALNPTADQINFVSIHGSPESYTYLQISDFLYGERCLFQNLQSIPEVLF